MTLPPDLDWAGVTSATMGSTMPEYSDMELSVFFRAASPLTTPTSSPSVTKVLYSLRDSR
jgi:hypothetical protein